MATSGTLNTAAWSGSGGTRYFEFAWERTSYDILAQTSTIKWTLTARGSFTGYVVCQKINVVVDGETVLDKPSRQNVYPNQVMGSGTKTLQHNIDGTKSFAVSVKAAIYTASVNSTASTTYSITNLDMARAVLESAPNFTDEDNPTIKYRNPIGTALTKLEACISLTGSAADIPYRTISTSGGSYTFNLTDDERKTLRAATQGSNTRKVFYYLRNTIQGEIYFTYKEVDFTVINAAPVLNVGVVDTNANTIALTGDETKLIKYHSSAFAAMEALAQKEATITTQKIQHSGTTVRQNYFTKSNVENNTFVFIATDSRNNTTTKTLTPTMVAYFKPTINPNTEELMDTDGNYNVRCTGNFFNASFGAATNSLTVKYRYRTQDSSTWGNWYAMDATKSGNTYNATATATGLDYRTTYVFQCAITDSLNTTISAEVVVVSLPVFHWSKDEFTFEVPVKFNAGSNLGSGSGTGSAGNSGTWKPALTTAAAVSSYTTQEGWYSRVGNVVMIGWQLKATTKSGYYTTELAISGLPFTPAISAFGGGVAHNIYTLAGFNFECWAVGTDGLITARLQPCNGQSAGNLNISSTTYYPTGSGNVLTLAGTICYITND